MHTPHTPGSGAPDCAPHRCIERLECCALLLAVQVTARGMDAGGRWLDLVAPPADDGIHSGIALPGGHMLFLTGEAPKRAWGAGAWVKLTRA